MKRLIITISILAYIGGIEPKPEPVEPTAIKLSDFKPVEQWDLTKAYYRHVKLPDGSMPQLKIISAEKPTDKQWLQKADEIYKGKLEFEKIPETCPFCGRPM